MSDPVEILDFWLGEIGPEGWYAGGDEIDAICRARFIDIWQAARDGGLDHWIDGTVGTLAFIILTDQLPRNMFRGTADSFATDPRALAAARLALAQGWDMGAPEPERQFFYMPFEHSENPDDQALALRLMEERLASDPDKALHARAHQAVIARFGRFPGRNAALGRVSSAAEQDWLDQGGYAAEVRRLQATGSHAPDA
ncbi:DUF924 family protein [Paragemmobacter ruber]|uniref:DUF924 family protein n=1 Tax=Paragemmobacter ruber TaxID=1985673 RepID=A0ABW9Y9I4_9RHOB|nr:DUF924 family protein [Rhodobacter ruber]NBE08467.1 DUF924 family protein [Rhodobacter ruber]